MTETVKKNTPTTPTTGRTRRRNRNGNRNVSSSQTPPTALTVKAGIKPNSYLAENYHQLCQLFQKFNITHFGPPYPPQTTTNKNSKEKLQQWFTTFPQHEKIIQNINSTTLKKNTNTPPDTNNADTLVPVMGVEGFYNKNLTQEETLKNSNELMKFWSSEKDTQTVKVGIGTLMKYCQKTSTLTIASFDGSRFALIILTTPHAS